IRFRILNHPTSDSMLDGLLDTVFNCDACRQGFIINGITRDGGYAEYLVARYEALAIVPGEVDAAELAPMMCAGLTCFNAIRNMNVKPGELVAVQGIGGLGHLAIQICQKMGLKTVAISSGAAKKPLSLQLGAQLYIDASTSDPVVELNKLGGAKLIVATAPSGKAIAPLVGGLGMDGTLLLLAAPEPFILNGLALIPKRAKVMGWSSGHAKDAEETITFCNEAGIKCHVEKFKLEDVEKGFSKMVDNSVRFRSVLVF
ncbi:hypothetical protein HDU76_003238, partial [Blyttiomyces sp. JEL0837]